MNVHELREQRAAKIADMRALGDDLAGEKATAFDKLEGEVRAIDGKIKRAETLAEMERRSEAAPDAEMERETRDYSVAKAIREAASGKLTGREAEMHQELSRDREVRGVMIPTSAILETRAMTTGGSAGSTVATQMGQMIDRLRPTLAVQGLGATVISGLVGNLDLPRLTGGPTAYWVDEDTPATESDSTFDKVSLAAKTVSGEMYLSRRLTLQNGAALENVLRNDLGFVLAQALDAAAIKGGGTSEPSGVLSAIAESATTETEISDIAADLIAALELDDVTGSRAFLTNPALMAAARKVKDTTGRTIPVREIFHQERVVDSNQVKDETGAHPLIFGNWSDLIVGYWSGVDILANPYTDASKGGLRLHAFLDADIAVRHAESFAWKAVA